jgi:hypothetical protein
MTNPIIVAADLTDPDNIFGTGLLPIQLRGDNGVPYDRINVKPIEGVTLNGVVYILERFTDKPSDDNPVIYRAILTHIAILP